MSQESRVMAEDAGKKAREELERASRLAEETAIPGLVALTQSSLSSSMLDAERFEAAEPHASQHRPELRRCRPAVLT